jgi:opacity protein-like surface antigen
MVSFPLALLAALAPSNAQTTSGSIAGQVSDPSGAVVASAKVTLLNEQTGIERTAVTDNNGAYVFPIVQPGVYTVRVEMAGFKAYAIKGLQVQVAQQVAQDIRLEVGETSTSVEVSATATLLEQRNAEVSQVIGQRQMVELPLNGRNFMDLARLAPGVTQLAGTSQSTGLAINGQRANQIGFYFDGIDTRTEERGKPAFSPSIEAIQEFRIQQNSFSAEFGRTPAAINLTLKSGTNELHGAVFEFLRNDALDARSFFSPTVDPLRRNQFGGVVSGPILRNRTFYMANYEGLRTRRAASLYHTVPTEKQREGDFTEGNPVFDPATYNAASNTRQPFPNSIIPKTRFAQMGNSVLKYFPSPNAPLAGGFNYLVRTANTDDNDQFHGRVDHQINERSVLFGRYSWSDSTAENPSGLPLTGSIDTTGVHSLTAQQSQTLSPTKINQFRAGWTFYDTTLTFPRASSNLTFTEFGLRNLNPPEIAQGLPRFETVGLSLLGASPFQPQGPRENIYSLADDFSWIAGRHTLKFGFDGRYYRPAGKVQVTPNSALTFQNRYTTQPGVARSGSSVADMLLGAVFSGRATAYAESNGLVSLKYYYTGFYFQDEIRLARQLTATVGMRYEYQTPYKERYNDLVIFDPVLGRFLEVGKDIEWLHRPDKNNFSPRAGIAWTVLPKTVVRAGAGVFYGQPRGSEFTSFQLSPPFVVDSTLNSNPNVPDLEGRLFPAPQVRDPATGAIRFFPTTNIFTLDYNFRTNYTWQWNFGVQHELAGNLMLELGYVGNGGHKLTGRDLVNQAFPDADPTRSTPVQGRRPNPNVGDLSVVKSLDNSNYHALNLRVDKRFSGGFSILGAYTWSKAMGIGGALFGDQSNQQDARNRRAEYAVLEFNQDHRLTAAWIYELPFAKRRLAGGWSFQGSLTAHTGFPLTPRSTVSSNVGRQDQNRADRLCDGNLDPGARSIDRWFNTACFVNHPFGRFGNSGNGVIEGPGLQSFNLTAMKNTFLPIGRQEPLNLQFRAEFFNAFNHPSFGDPNMNAGTAQFGFIRSTRVGGRQIQLALKLIF